MSKVDTFETETLALVFTNVSIANIGNPGGILQSSVAGDFFIALFTSDPTDAGSIANEASYGSYARKSVARSTAQWSVSGPTPTKVENDNDIVFIEGTAGATETISHFAICKAGTAGVADLIYYGALTSTIDVGNGITAKFAAGALTVQEE
jgi:hypothetical protein